MDSGGVGDDSFSVYGDEAQQCNFGGSEIAAHLGYSISASVSAFDVEQGQARHYGASVA